MAKATRTGIPANYTSNWGVEGPTDDPAINADARSRQARHAGHCVPCRRHADAAGRRRIRPHPSAATTTPIARTTRYPGWTGAWRASPPGTALTALRRATDRASPRTSGAAQPDFLHGRAQPAPGIADIAWFDQDGRNNSSRGLERSRAADVGVAPRHAGSRTGRSTILTLAAQSDGDSMCTFGLPEPHLSWHACCSTVPSRRLTNARDARQEISVGCPQRGADVRRTRSGDGMSDGLAHESCRLAQPDCTTDERGFAFGRPRRRPSSVAIERRSDPADGALAGRLVRGDRAVRCRHALSLSPGGRNAGARSRVARAGR